MLGFAKARVSLYFDICLRDSQFVPSWVIFFSNSQEFSVHNCNRSRIFELGVYKFQLVHKIENPNVWFLFYIKILAKNVSDCRLIRIRELKMIFEGSGWLNYELEWYFIKAYFTSLNMINMNTACTYTSWIWKTALLVLTSWHVLFCLFILKRIHY